MTAILADSTGKPFNQVASPLDVDCASDKSAQVFQDFSRDRYFSAQEALEYGLVDVVLPPPKRSILDT